MSLQVLPLDDALSFGARIRGVSRDALRDEAVRGQINDVFEDRGLIVFEDVEPTGEMHIAVSNVFGPLKEHPVPSISRVDADTMPGVIDMYSKPNEGKIVEIDGKRLTAWSPWHFDHCYNNELNRAGVLRAIIIAPEGGLTCFCDGFDLYNAFPPELRSRIEGQNVIYTLNLLYEHMRFGLPKGFRNVFTPPSQYELLERSKSLPRAIHPAVWTRKDGRKVMHVSPWMSVGIEGHEDPEGDALLQAVCEAVYAKVQAYCHHWKLTDMVIWDNWRMLHSVSGCDPQYPRRMHRTTIKGDYGLGYFENNGVGNKVLEMTV
jgi:alpha-ketoglutarate-dependent taurine dioxygenase